MALLAQACSNIGNDSPSSFTSISNSLSTKISLPTTKSSSDLTDSNKLLSLNKRLSPMQTNKMNKFAYPSETNIVSTSSSFVEPHLLSNHLSSLFAPTSFVAASFLYFSLAYLACQEHLYSLRSPITECLQCETVRRSFSSKTTNQSYVSHWASRKSELNSQDKLIKRIRYNHRFSKISNYHPYLRTSRMINTNNQFLLFSPHLSSSPISQTR